MPTSVELKYDPTCKEKVEVLSCNPVGMRSSATKPGYVPVPLNIVRAADNARKFIQWKFLDKERGNVGVNPTWKGTIEFPFS